MSVAPNAKVRNPHLFDNFTNCPMGCCPSICGRHNFDGPAEPKFGPINIREHSDSDSDPVLKAKGLSQKTDGAPLLHGPTLLTRNLALTSSSSSVDSELEHVGKLLTAPAKGGATFKDVPAVAPPSDESDEST
jgi:hypothetical protein